MDIVIHGTKGGCKIFTPKKLSGLLDITSDGSRAAAMGQQAYGIRFTADYAIFSKYKIVRDVRGDKRTGFLAFSLFLTNKERLSGKEIINLLDKVSTKYCEKYIGNDNNLNEVTEDWESFDLDGILNEYETKPCNRGNIQSGTKDDAYIYYPYIYKAPETLKQTRFELEDIFDSPFQEAYTPFRQILLVEKELQGKDENPLNALRHSDNDLTGKIDLGKEGYSHSKAVSYTRETGDNTLHSELQGTKKSLPSEKSASEKTSGHNTERGDIKKEPFYKKYATILLVGFLVLVGGITLLCVFKDDIFPDESGKTKSEGNEIVTPAIKEDSIPIPTVENKVEPDVSDESVVSEKIPAVSNKKTLAVDKGKQQVPKKQEDKIISYLKNSPELHIDTINKYLNVTGLSTPLTQSLNAYKDFWNSVQQDSIKDNSSVVNKIYASNNILLKNSNLIQFIENIFNKDSDEYFKKYQKIQNKQNIKTLTDLKKAINAFNTVERTIHKRDTIAENQIRDALQKDKTLSANKLRNDFKTNDEKLRKSIALYVGFWDLMDNNQMDSWMDYLKNKIEKDPILQVKDGELRKFLTTILTDKKTFKIFNEKVRVNAKNNTTLQDLIDIYGKTAK